MDMVHDLAICNRSAERQHMLINDRFDFIQDLSKLRPVPSDSTVYVPLLRHYLLAQIIGLHPPDEQTSTIPSIHFQTLAYPDVFFHRVGKKVTDFLPPSYDDTTADIPWLEKSLVTWHIPIIRYIPNPNGSTVQLDDSFTGFANDLGIVQTRCGAKVVSLVICAPLSLPLSSFPRGRGIVCFPFFTAAIVGVEYTYR